MGSLGCSVSAGSGDSTGRVQECSGESIGRVEECMPPPEPAYTADHFESAFGPVFDDDQIWYVVPPGGLWSGDAHL